MLEALRRQAMRCGWLGLLLAAVCCGSLAQAQAPFPSKPIRFVITSPPGGANDILISHVLLAHPSLPAGSVQELIALARSKPGQLNYASSGNGSTFHLGMELFKRMAGVDLVHVPFKGRALSVNAMLAGDVQVMLIGSPTGLPLAKSGKLRGLAIAGGRRLPLAPELPTIAESGLPGYEISSWFGAVAPAKTRAAVIAKLHGEFVRALHAPEVRERLAPAGYEIIANTPEQFASHMRAQMKRLARLIKETGARPD